MRIGRRFRNLGTQQRPTFTERSQPSTAPLAGGTDDLSLSNTRLAQSFVAWGTSLSHFTLTLASTGSPADSVVVELQSHNSGTDAPSGSVLASTTIAAATFPNQQPRLIPLHASLTPGTTYWVVLRRTGADDASNCRGWRRSTTGADLYSGGVGKASSNGGITYGAATGDYTFEMGQQVGGVALRNPNLGPKPPQVVSELPFAPPISTQFATLRRASRYGTARGTHYRLAPPTVVTEEAPFVAEPIKTDLQAVKGRLHRTRRERHLGWYPATTDTSRTEGPTSTDLGMFSTNLDLAADRVGQSFVARGPWIHGFTVMSARNGTPTDNLVVEIQTDSGTQPSGTVVGSRQFSAAQFNTSFRLHEFPAGIAVTPGTRYWLVLRRSGADDAANSINVRGTFSDTYSQGKYAESSNSGGSWSDFGGTFDLIFTVSWQVGQQAQRVPLIGLRPPQVIAEKPIAPPIAVHTVAVSSRRTRHASRERHLEQGWQEVTNERAFSYFRSTGVTTDFDIDATTDLTANSFQAAGTALTHVQLFIDKISSPADNLIVQLRTDDGSGTQPSSTVLASLSIPAAQVPSQTLFKVPLGYGPLTPGTRYWVVVGRSVTDALNFYQVKRPGSAAVDSVREPSATSTNGGTNWTTGLRTFYYGYGQATGSFPMRLPSLGPRPPQTITENPLAQPIKVTTDAVHPARRHPSRATRSKLAPPTFAEEAEAVAYPGPVVHTVRTRPRATHSFLRPPTVLQTFDGPRVWLATRLRLQRRPSYPELRPPAVVEPSLLGSDPRLRIRTFLVRTRPRPTQAAVAAPATLVPAGEPNRDQSTITTVLARIRPRPTEYTLRKPTVLQVFAGASTWLTPRLRLNRRPGEVLLRKPAVVEPSLLGSDPRLTIRTHLVQTRPRPTQTVIEPPATLVPATQPIADQLEWLARWQVRTRPRPTESRLRPPAVVEPSLLGSDPRLTINVTLARTRPRPTTHFLTPQPPAVLAAPPIRVELARIRPRPTTSQLSPPAVVEGALRAPDRRLEILTSLVRTRPRPTTSHLGKPTVLEVFFGPVVHLVRTRPRPTVRRLGAPTVLRTFAGPLVVVAVRARLAARRVYRSILRQPVVVEEPVPITAVSGDVDVSDSAVCNVGVSEQLVGFEANVEDGARYGTGPSEAATAADISEAGVFDVGISDRPG